jgi:hypothetical protein
MNFGGGHTPQQASKQTKVQDSVLYVQYRLHTLPKTLQLPLVRERQTERKKHLNASFLVAVLTDFYIEAREFTMKCERSDNSDFQAFKSTA